MKRLVLLALVGLPVLALPAPARADVPIQLPCLPPMRMDAGIKAYFSLTYPGPQGFLPPWYTYFPYDAYFQTPPPTGLYFPQLSPPVRAAGVPTPPTSPRPPGSGRSATITSRRRVTGTGAEWALAGRMHSDGSCEDPSPILRVNPPGGSNA